jgi:hypothetical protein
LLKAKEKGTRAVPSLFWSLLLFGVDGLKLRFEGRAVFRELLDREALGLVVS